MIRICQYFWSNLSINNFRQYAIMATKSLNTNEKHTAGLIIIGDELLKAQVKDTNSYFMCTLLYACGVKVEKISIISDDVNKIAEEIKVFSQAYKYVITSGGVGVTHDDVTYEGLAKAFNDTLHHHPTIVNIVKNVYQTEDLNHPGFQLAKVPTKTNLKFGKRPDSNENLPFPCINVENVYSFPGSPIYLQPLFQSLHKELFDAKRSFIKKELYMNVSEDLFANELTNVAKEFAHIAFGSYPVSDQSNYKARITIESDNENDVESAIKRFRSLVPENFFVNIDKSTINETNKN